MRRLIKQNESFVHVQHSRLIDTPFFIWYSVIVLIIGIYFK